MLGHGEHAASPAVGHEGDGSRAPVDLGGLVDDSVLDARAIDPGRTIETELATGITVLGDEHRLHQVLANLLGNALRHSPRTAAVRVSLSSRERVVR
ncbi:MAG: hypothetical protein HGB17_18275 [Syntrophobacteraceae bacterium]|nr:hypothetical protein [Syntrophobacteraceae bacterium]